MTSLTDVLVEELPSLCHNSSMSPYQFTSDLEDQFQHICWLVEKTMQSFGFDCEIGKHGRGVWNMREGVRRASHEQQMHWDQLWTSRLRSRARDISRKLYRAVFYMPRMRYRYQWTVFRMKKFLKICQKFQFLVLHSLNIRYEPKWLCLYRIAPAPESSDDE